MGCCCVYHHQYRHFYHYICSGFIDSCTSLSCDQEQNHFIESFRNSVAKARYQRSAWQASRHRKTHVFANIVGCWRVYCHEYRNFCHYIRRENVTKNFEQKHSSKKISKFCGKKQFVRDRRGKSEKKQEKSIFDDIMGCCGVHRCQYRHSVIVSAVGILIPVKVMAKNRITLLKKIWNSVTRARCRRSV